MNSFKPDQKFPMTIIDGVPTTMGDFIMKPGPDEYVQYLDGNPFNCQRSNMRLVKNNLN